MAMRAPRPTKASELGGIATAEKFRAIFGARDAEIKRLDLQRVPKAEIARRLGLSRQRVYQILSRETAA